MPEIKPRPYPTDLELERNFLSLKEHVEDVDFKRWFPSRTFLDFAGTPTQNAQPGGTYWNLIDGEAHTAVVVPHYRPDYWRLGKVAVTLYYTSDVVDAGQFVIRTRVSAYDTATAITSATGAADGIEETRLFGPGTAYYLMTHTTGELDWLDLTADYPYFALAVGRLGTDVADTHPGDFIFIGAMLQFYPTRR